MNPWITVGVGVVAAVVINAARNNSRNQNAGSAGKRAPADGSRALDYDRSIHLDAEDLAEGGIGEAYHTRVLPRLREILGAQPVIYTVTDHVSEDVERYTVTAAGREHIVYSAEAGISATQSWGRAAYVLFTIVNEQLQSSTHRFYAINGGNDLAGMFLTPAEAEAARAELPGKSDWPYLPTLEDPWFGQHHD